MKKFIFIFCCILAVAANGQLVIKNSSQTVLVQVSPTGDTKVTGSVKVMELRNTSGGNESSLIGAGTDGTLIKSDLSLQSQGLIFFPVNRSVLVGNTNPGGVIQGSIVETDSLNGALDIQTIAGITLPVGATHVLIEYILALWAKQPPDDTYYNLAVGLYIADVMPADQWAERPGYVSAVDGGRSRRPTGDANLRDNFGAYLQQTSGSEVVKLSPTKTIAFRAKHFNTSLHHVHDTFQSSLCRLVLAGYYVPMSALLNQ